ncbi:MAG: FecR domain-containing protein [Nitrospirae bacterium]|nr:FecR domain-containing protein [Nitrospirota bacterium]
MQLLLKDEVETGKRARTKLFFIDDSILNLGELSRLEVEEYLYAPEKKRSRSIYRLINGSLKMVVGRSDLEIHTPTAVAAARGTKFFVWVGGSGDNTYTGVITLESEVAVRNIARNIAGEVIVKSGQMSRVYMNRPPEAARPVDLELMRQFSDQTLVLGNTTKGTDGLPDDVQDQLTEGLYMFHPPLAQEPIETTVPVTVEVIFP